MPWLALAEKPLFKPKSRAFLLSDPKPSIMVLSRQPQPVTPRFAQNDGCPNSSFYHHFVTDALANLIVWLLRGNQDDGHDDFILLIVLVSQTVRHS